MIPQEIAAAVIGFLTPYLIKGGEAAAERLGEAAGEKVSELYNAVAARLKKKKGSKAAQTLEQYTAHPAEHETAMQEKLVELLKKDAEFRERVTTLVDEVKNARARNISTTNISGNSSVGTVFSPGEAHGEFTFNNTNTFNSPAKKKRTP